MSVEPADFRRRKAKPLRTSDKAPRCRSCRKKLAEILTRPWRVVCPRCGEVNSR